MKWQFRRNGKRNEPRRSYTQFEMSVWRERPYGCHSWREALEHFNSKDPAKQKQREELERIKEHAKRIRDWEAIPEWCHRHEHPLRTGRRGRLYHKSDVVGPIIDAMTMLHEGKSDDAFGLFVDMDREKKKRRKKDGYDEAEDKEQARRDREIAMREPGAKYAEAQKHGPRGAPVWECACCGNTDVKTQVQHKDALLCPCGFVVRIGGALISTHREKLGAEEGEDKTQHADKPREQRVHWADTDHVPSVTERRNQRKGAGKISNIGTRVKGLGRLCDVQRLSEELAAKEQRFDDVRNGFKLTPKDETKGWNIIEQVNQLARTLAPVEHEVMRTLRLDADKVWFNAVRHCRTCQRADCCEMRLIERTPAIIAASVFETTIERLLHTDSEDGPRVTRQHLLDIQMRMQRSSTFTNTPAITQMNTAKAMINIMQAPSFDPDVMCAPSLPKPSNYLGMGAVFANEAKSRPPPLSTRTPFARNDSSVSTNGGHSPPPTDAVQMRDAVGTVFLAHRSELPNAVRDGALRAVQSPGFVEAVGALEDLKTCSLQCKAFCIINAVRRQQLAAEPGPSFSGSSSVEAAFNVGIAMKLNLDLAVAEESINSIRDLVPTDATSEASHGDDDDLFS